MITKLRSNIFLSGRIDEYSSQQLKDLGINSILNVAFEVSDPVLEPHDFSMVKIALAEESGKQQELKLLAISTLKTLLEAGKTVLVHCFAGANRSPYIAFRTIAELENKTIDEIAQELLPLIHYGVVYPSSISI